MDKCYNSSWKMEEIIMWTFFCLFTVLAWACTELFGKIGSKINEDDKLSHWKITAIVGFVMGILAMNL